MRLRKPTPSMVVALTALTVAFGGTAYAAVKITSSDIKNGSILSRDIKAQSLTGHRIKTGTISKRTIGKGAVGASEVANGSLGRQDFKSGALPAGPTGPAGPAGPAGSGRWALVNDTGAIEAQSGGFSVTSAYAGANNNVYINANEPLDDNGVVATVAIDNQSANQNFAGEISTSRCAIPGVVLCAPAGTNDVNHFVVSPRNSDGTATVAGARKRFYVVITGDSTDFVAPAAR